VCPLYIGDGSISYNRVKGGGGGGGVGGYGIGDMGGECVIRRMKLVTPGLIMLPTILLLK
tara:strand:+ start:50 stop:229 length:180 start_codon:yes stop_codon:yes gene_type:complete